MKKSRKITAYFLISLFVVMIVLVPSISAKPSDADYEWIAECIKSEKHVFEPNGHAAAMVNGQPILSSEVSRRVVNMEILMKMQLGILKETRSNNFDEVTLQDLIEKNKLEYEKQGSAENQLRELIIEELLFQESCKSVSMVDFHEAYRFEKELFSMMSEKEKAPLEKYAKGLELTSEEYIQKYLVPLRQRKLTINHYLESLFANKEPFLSVSQIDKALEELIESLLLRATIQYNP